MQQVRILIIDDHPLVRDGIRRALELEQHFYVIAEAGNGDEALRLTSSLRPDVVLMDIHLPGIDGLGLTRLIRRCCPRAAIVILTICTPAAFASKAAAAGAAAYCSKDIEASALVSVINRVVAGESLLLEVAEEEPLGDFDSLTAREIEVLDCLVQSAGNKEIAKRLQISEQTVKSHIAAILRKLDVPDRTGAVVAAVRKGRIS